MTDPSDNVRATPVGLEHRPQGWTRIALLAAVAVPVLYFGAQGVAMPFYPGYDPLRMPASALGADYAPHPQIFNAGVIVVAAATFLAAPGYAVALRSRAAHWLMVSLVTAALASSAAASLWAGSFHLPSPRHNPGWLGVGIFAFPPLLLLTTWRLPGARPLRYFLVGTLLGVAALAPFMGGLLGPQPYPGLLQRIFALLAYLPVAAGAVFLLAARAEPGAAG